MLRNYLLIIGLLLLVSSTVNAQVYGTQYRPPGQQWQQLLTPHFELIFSKENESAARRMGQILEKQYKPINQLVGGKLKSFPVILNSYNDRSNGFVTPFHFRSEIELPPIKGKSLNPQTGGWLENVGPHELVHALQLNNIGYHNLPWVISFFSPDLARSFHGAIPSGVTEGLAVYHETKSVSENGGRGNYPFFTNQFEATFDSDRRWSMGQMLQNPLNTRPFNRHYIGGYTFTAWLQDTFGPETSRQALDYYMDFPFLGYGVALWQVTGFWPGQLYHQFEKAKKSDDNEARNSGPAVTIQELSIPYSGRDIRRPKWLSDSTLVFYGSFYNARSGFYRYDLNTHHLDRLLTTGSVGDYRYDLSDDRSRLIYSYYDSDAIYNNAYKTELMEYDLSQDKSLQLTQKERLYAPVYTSDGLWALQTRPASSALVSLNQSSASERTSEQLFLGDHQITAMTSSPKDGRLAVVVNKNGLQGLWIVNREDLESVETSLPDISFQNGSIFDPEWHPTKNKLMFSSDFSGSLQLYEYDFNREMVVPLTNVPYNAFEGSYSPDGRRIAFIRQEKNERLPVVLSLADTSGTTTPVAGWKPDNKKAAIIHPNVIGDSIRTASRSWITKPYRSGAKWLKPRAFLPLVEEVDGNDAYQYGISMYSNNLLQNQAYAADLSYIENRFWYDLSYENKEFFPGFRLGLSSEPSYFSVTGENQETSQRLLRQQRSFSVEVPITVRYNQNIFSSSLYLKPELRYSQLRFFELGNGNNTSDFGNTLVSNLYGQFNYRLQKNVRDLQPNSGWIFYSELEHFWSSTHLQLMAGERSINLRIQQPTALMGGLMTYLSPLRRWNQSLRLKLEGLTQSGLIFNNQSLVSDAFAESVLPRSQNMLSFNTRYTIPLLFADNGGFLLPLYLNNIYLVAFSNTVTDPKFADWYNQSRTVFGVGLRTRFRLSNLAFEFGIGYGYEPTRRNHQLFIGDF